MTVSIALCTYNGERYLRQQLDSFLEQTILPGEIVVCDDGSTDATLTIVHEYAAAHPGIDWQIHRNSHTLRAPANFEKAIGLCTKEVIFLSDQDDIWEKEKIQRLVHYLETEKSCEAVFTNARLIDEKGVPMPGTLLDNTFFSAGLRKNFDKERLFYWSILLGNIITGATMAIKRTALPRILPFRLQLHRRLWHDGYIGFRLMAAGSMGYLDEPLIRYRIHAAQQVGLAGEKDPFEDSIVYGEEHFPELSKAAYFTRYLSAYQFMKRLQLHCSFAWPVDQTIERDYRQRRHDYLRSMSWPARKGRLLKWWLLRINDVSLKDLFTQ
ncbi:glycosyltransferase family 2 protein [Puia dinghuensis]|uniref:Glycosyltransferase 2-like domain-containing protein n=1 Tax=Puia dinghuensis TaxID=1792502 RepID=A0A8J2XU40_9BACT|nr:glycosyltransferase family 2 protein [Puia dinghuensis]GGB08530.1 hypothetical protein GCM10011511_35010 [Puia dinghuensis]